jgi:hypothetical protein
VDDQKRSSWCLSVSKEVWDGVIEQVKYSTFGLSITGSDAQGAVEQSGFSGGAETKVREDIWAPI